jgi:hypothetical protein
VTRGGGATMVAEPGAVRAVARGSGGAAATPDGGDGDRVRALGLLVEADRRRR